MKTRDDASARDDDAWTAVLARDASRDGGFVYAVVTTGVYCRPSCPSRRPRRENVRFFDSPALAEGACFRACLRCHPAGRTDDPLERARQYLDAHADDAVTLDDLGAAVGISPTHLQRTFKARFGVSPKQYAQARRGSRWKAALRRGDVTGAIYEAGYNASSRAYAESPAVLGMAPSAYRRGGAGLRVRYAIAPVAVGLCLVACTDRGLCAAHLGDDRDGLLDALRRELPDAVLEPAAPDEVQVLSSAIARVDGRGAAALPLDVRATAFQRAVWTALQHIPAGETRTYGQLAAELGRPTASRAVARACGQNPVAVVVPCHRVIGADGALTGYRWGLPRKRALLAREGALGPDDQDARPARPARPATRAAARRTTARRTAPSP